MRNYLKKDLGVEAAIIDTQASYGGITGTYRESFNDFIDMHAYWQHPNFPGRPWDGANWNIRNTPMVADKNGGNLARLGIYHVAGKPYTVSEYDHPAPSHYAAEMFPMIASFAALQDWDGLFQFDWGGTDSNSRRISGYFSLQQHPGKLAFLPAAALMFRRGDIEPATGLARLSIPTGKVEELTANNVSMLDAWKQAGLTTANILTHRLELCFDSDSPLKAMFSEKHGSSASWNSDASLYMVDSRAVKVVVGNCTGRSTQMKDVEFEIKANARNFAVLTLNTVDRQSIPQSRRMLLTVVGNVENTGMGWNADHTSVGTKWGTPPTICEGISGRMKLASNSRTAKVYALNGTGERAGEVPATITTGHLAFDFGPQYRTLWYEIACE
jgi:hypothetical protein